MNIPFEDLNIASPAFKADPFPLYARLRESKPVCAVKLPSGERAWLLTRYDDVAALLKDNRFAKDRANAQTPTQLAKQRRVPGIFAPLMRNMLDRDDPDHARLRKLVHIAFTPRRVEMMAAQTERISAGLIDGLRVRSQFDLINDFALPLPVIVICELLGVPVRDQKRFARYSKTMIRNTMTPLSVILSLPDMIGFVRYLRSLVAMKRVDPQDDLITALVQAEDEGAQLDADELVGMIALLLTAGHETTTNLIANGMLALMQNPEQSERIRHEPSLHDSAVEELLRFGGLVDMSTFRFARADLEIAGQMIPQGEIVLGVISSANRDDARFTAPEALDVARTPNKHLTFGQGGHYCVGAALARLEGKVAIRDLATQLPSLHLVGPVDGLRWRRGLVLRGLEALPVRL